MALLLCVIGSASIASAQTTANAVYRLVPGDQISLTLPLNPELNAAGPIGPDGQFSVPLVGRVALGGRSLDEAEALVARMLSDKHIVADARPNIAVSQFGGTVYVGGEVRTPSSVRLTQGLNPMQAIISAGGLLDSAKSRQIAIIRPVETGPAVITKVDLRDYIRSGNRSAAIVLMPGDIVFVPKSGIAEVDLWIEQHVNKVVPRAFNFNANLGNGAAIVR